MNRKANVKENRRYPRVNMMFPVRFSMHDEPVMKKENHAFAGRAVNISACGICLNTRVPLQEGDIVRLVFLKPKTFLFFDGFGKVVYSTPDGAGTFYVGIDFEDMTVMENKLLDYYLTL